MPALRCIPSPNLASRRPSPFPWRYPRRRSICPERRRIVRMGSRERTDMCYLQVRFSPDGIGWSEDPGEDDGGVHRAFGGEFAFAVDGSKAKHTVLIAREICHLLASKVQLCKSTGQRNVVGHLLDKLSALERRTYQIRFLPSLPCCFLIRNHHAVHKMRNAIH
jgi:hypothetical protein